MRVVLYFVVLVAGFSSHAAINSKSNADCLQGKKGVLWENTAVSKPTQLSKPAAPAPTQLATIKGKTQGT